MSERQSDAIWRDTDLLYTKRAYIDNTHTSSIQLTDGLFAFFLCGPFYFPSILHLLSLSLIYWSLSCLSFYYLKTKKKSYCAERCSQQLHALFRLIQTLSSDLTTWKFSVKVHLYAWMDLFSSIVCMLLPNRNIWVRENKRHK